MIACISDHLPIIVSFGKRLQCLLDLDYGESMNSYRIVFLSYGVRGFNFPLTSFEPDAVLGIITCDGTTGLEVVVPAFGLVVVGQKLSIVIQINRLLRSIVLDQ